MHNKIQQIHPTPEISPTVYPEAFKISTWLNIGMSNRGKTTIRIPIGGHCKEKNSPDFNNDSMQFMFCTDLD
jgi:hypothetical protein